MFDYANAPFITTTLEDLLAAFPSSSGPRGSGSTGPDADEEIEAFKAQIDMEALRAAGDAGYDSLPKDLKDRFAAARKASKHLDDLWVNGSSGSKNDGSEHIYALASNLSGLPTGHVFDIMDLGRLVWTWPFAEGSKGLEAGGLGNGEPRSLARAWRNGQQGRKAKEAFAANDNIGGDPEAEAIVQEVRARARENAGSSAVPGSRSGLRWKEWDHRLVELEEAREEIRVNHADIEVYGRNTPDFGTEKDEPFVTSRHARGEVSMTVAPPARGKTLLAITTAIAIVLEKPEMLTDDYSRDPTEVTDWAGDVVLVLNETAGRAQAMLAAAEAVHGYKKAELKHEIHIYPRQLVLAEMGPHGVVPTAAGLEFLRWLIGKRKKAQLALVVFDTFASTISGLPENSVDAMQPVMDMMAAMSKAGFCAVEAIHHVAKSGSNIDAYQGRGSGATGAAVRSMSSLARRDEDDKSRLVLSSLKASHRPDSDDVEFKVVSHVRQVERARAPGNFRTASIAVLKRMTATEVGTENSAREEQNLRDGAYALDIAVLAGTIIRPGGVKRNGHTKGGGTWKSAWAIIQEAQGASGMKGKTMNSDAAKAVVARLEARKVLKRVPEGEGETFELVPGWEQLVSQKVEEF